MQEIKPRIQDSIKVFDSGDLTERSLALFKTLGYVTDRQNPLSSKTYRCFKESFLDSVTRFSEDKAFVSEWKYVDLLFQLSKDEIIPQAGLFDTKQVDNMIMESYLFFVIELSKSHYSRTALSQITREVNKVFRMPVMLLFKHGKTITLGVINRRLNEKDENKDVLKKVTLIKDISIKNSHRAHIDILFDLSFEELSRKHKFTNFVELHKAWTNSLNMDAVTDAFYKKFKPLFDEIVSDVRVLVRDADQKTCEDFTLLFVIRVIFIGFIQRRKWIGNNEDFLKDFLAVYWRSSVEKNTFYSSWLMPLFFEALNNPPGRPVALDNQAMPDEYKKILQMAPYLNGGLFIKKPGMDDIGLAIPDAAVERYFSFIFSYYFAIEENTPLDEEISLNPEFLGVIFERLVNKENGAVYTPRTEVDFMCRMALVKWLEKNNTTNIPLEELYKEFFREGGPNAGEDEQHHGNFTADQKKNLIDLLETVAICDPAAGSGAFLVGMLHVLDEIEQSLRGRIRDADYKEDTFSRKQRVIARSLYGVEVKGWAVWITQLRLWVTLFIDAPESMRASFEPILPSLDFKVRQGDSLVQRIGKKMFPVGGHADIPKAVKAKVTKLRELKTEFFQNKHKSIHVIRQAERRVFQDILSASIEEKRNELSNLGNVQNDQIDFLGGSKEVQGRLDFHKERIEQLKTEIAELQEEKDALSGSDWPLIWNIEFAEIFFDKGGFDIIIGNPPYVRQEAIADPMGKIKNTKEYKDVLAEMVQADFPREFSKEKLNAQSDLYTYFYIRSLRLLNERGVHVFICSNSWLDVGYGVWLQKFLLNYAPLHFIFDNHSKRSFAAADVNTIISVVGAPVKKVAKDHMVKFVAFKLPFEEVVFTENLLEIEQARAVEANEKFRVYPITDGELFKSGLEVSEDSPGITATGKYIGEKWGGKFLRAPDIFFTILEKGKGKLVKLDNLAEVLPGCYSGINDFFYFDDVRVQQNRIEKQYCKELVRNSDSVTQLKLPTMMTNYVLAVPSISASEIKKFGHNNVLSYIKWGEGQVTRKRQKTAAGIPWPKVESVKNRRFWYSIPENNLLSTKLFMQYVSNDRFYCPYSEQALISDRCFHRLFPKGEVDHKVLAAVLNSTLQIFFVMLLGRSNLGQGALKFEASDAKNVLVLDMRGAEPKVAMAVTSAVEILGKRIAVSIFEECGLDRKRDIRDQEPQPLPDRKRLDDIVFDAIGLTVAERKEVYWSVCELVKNRLDKAGSV